MTSRRNALLLLPAILAAVLFLAGCGAQHCPTTFFTQSGSGSGGSTSTGGTICGAGINNGGPSAAFAFYLDTAVETGSIGTNGSFTTLTGINSPALAGTTIDDMAVVNVGGHKFLYLPYGDINAVQAFTVSAGGVLSSIAGSPFPVLAAGSTDAIVSDPQGRFLFVGGEGTGEISAFTIDPTTGVLAQVAAPTNFGLSSADSMAVDGTGKFLYVCQLSSGLPTAVFDIDQNTGALSAAGLFGLNVAQIHADATGQYLLGVAEIQDGFGGATDQHIHVFALDQTTGAPSEILGSPFPTVAAPFDFAISPNNKFVYTTGNVAGGGALAAVEGFSFDATSGTLTPLAGSPFISEPSASQCKFDEAGALMICATSTGLSIFNANVSTGLITHGSDLQANNYPFAVTD